METLSSVIAKIALGLLLPLIIAGTVIQFNLGRIPHAAAESPNAALLILQTARTRKYCAARREPCSG